MSGPTRRGKGRRPAERATEPIQRADWAEKLMSAGHGLQERARLVYRKSQMKAVERDFVGALAELRKAIILEPGNDAFRDKYRELCKRVPGIDPNDLPVRPGGKSMGSNKKVVKKATTFIGKRIGKQMREIAERDKGRRLRTQGLYEEALQKANRGAVREALSDLKLLSALDPDDKEFAGRVASLRKACLDHLGETDYRVADTQWHGEGAEREASRRRQRVNLASPFIQKAEEALKRKKIDRAIGFAIEGLRHDTSNIKARLLLARAYAFNRRVEDAHTHLKLILKQDPDNAGAKDLIRALGL